jgi:hypothetical protein
VLGVGRDDVERDAVSATGDEDPVAAVGGEQELLLAAGARFLARLAKAAPKHWAGLTVVTQDAADLGQAVVANAATQILLRQAPQAIDRLAAAFRLFDGLSAARTGVGELGL